MAVSENHDALEGFRRLFTVRNSALLFIVFCIGTTLISVGITAVLAYTLGQSRDNEMGSIGQIFESVNAAFSGVGFIALVVTFRVQYDELVLQRQELKGQQTALQQSADADVRTCHMELIRMSMEDPDLAEVWPAFQTGLSTKVAKQYSYANLIIQHQKMLHDLGYFDGTDVKTFFRYLFSSKLVRDYWEARMVAREVAVPPGSAERRFEEFIDAAFSELQPPSVAAATADPDTEADVIDLDSRRESDTP